CQSTCSAVLTCREQEPCVPDFRDHHRNFWEEHSHLWNNYHDPVVERMPPAVRFVTRTDFYTYFNVPASRLNLSSRPMLTMFGALSLRGSSGCASLAREGITALLDAAVLGDRYPYPPGTWDFTSLYFAIRNNLYNGTF